MSDSDERQPEEGGDERRQREKAREYAAAQHRSREAALRLVELGEVVGADYVLALAATALEENWGFIRVCSSHGVGAGGGFVTDSNCAQYPSHIIAISDPGCGAVLSTEIGRDPDNNCGDFYLGFGHQRDFRCNLIRTNVVGEYPDFGLFEMKDEERAPYCGSQVGTVVAPDLEEKTDCGSGAVGSTERDDLCAQAKNESLRPDLDCGSLQGEVIVQDRRCGRVVPNDIIYEDQSGMHCGGRVFEGEVVPDIDCGSTEHLTVKIAGDARCRLQYSEVIYRDKSGTAASRLCGTGVELATEPDEEGCGKKDSQGFADADYNCLRVTGGQVDRDDRCNERAPDGHVYRDGDRQGNEPVEPLSTGVPHEPDEKEDEGGELPDSPDGEPGTPDGEPDKPDREAPRPPGTPGGGIRPGK